MTAPLSPAPALTAEEDEQWLVDQCVCGHHITAHAKGRDACRYSDDCSAYRWDEVGIRRVSARPAEPTSEQATVDRTDATDEEFRARIAVFDAAEEPEEIVVEKVARAILHAVLGDTDGGIVLDCDLPASEIARLIVEHAVPAALTALRGDRAPLAGQRTTDEEGR